MEGHPKRDGLEHGSPRPSTPQGKKRLQANQNTLSIVKSQRVAYRGSWPDGGADTMPSRWQREYMCTMCGGLVFSHYAEVQLYNQILRRKSMLWLLCNECVERVRTMLVNVTWASLNPEVLE